MIENTETLKQQVMVSHFTNATGCSIDQARQLLQTSRWEFETALSLFFQEVSVHQGTPHHQRHPVNGLSPMCPPCNTPATPPSFPDALLALQKLQASDWNQAASPQQTQPAKVLASCNYMPPFNDRYQTSCDWLPTGGAVAPKDPQPGEQIHHSGMSENNSPLAVSPQGMMFTIEAQQ